MKKGEQSRLPKKFTQNLQSKTAQRLKIIYLQQYSLRFAVTAS